MANQKFLVIEGGDLKEKQAIDTSGGVVDAGKLAALDATGRFSTTMMPVGVTAPTKQMLAGEDLAAGDFVNVYLAAGVAKARKADASVAGKEANGFILSSALTGVNALVYFQEINTQLSGLTIGATYFLSAATAGIGTDTAPSATGNIVQKLGKAISATEIEVQFSNPVTLA